MNQDSDPNRDIQAIQRRAILEKFVTEGADILNSGVPVEQFTAEDTDVLLNFLVFAARELLEKVKDRSTQASLAYGGDVEPFEDVIDLIHVAKLLRAELAFIAAPDHPALAPNLSIALFTAMANYIMIVGAMRRFLSYGELRHSVTWQNTMDMVYLEMPEGMHFPLLLKHVWLGLAIQVIIYKFHEKALPTNVIAPIQLFHQYDAYISRNCSTPPWESRRLG